LVENQIKAIGCTIPFMYQVHEIEFIRNQISDMMSPILLMAAFVNPHVVRFTFNDNFARNTFKRTFIELVKENGKKLSEISLQNAVSGQTKHLRLCPKP
jgi:hypothetical protein